jgi:hypothetical protein
MNWREILAIRLMVVLEWIIHERQFLIKKYKARWKW